MKILAVEIENSGFTSADFQPHLRPEAEKVWQLYKSDTIREIYYDTLRSSVLLILECSGKEEAEKILSELPLVKEGLIRFEIYMLKPYKGFERLMG